MKKVKTIEVKNLQAPEIQELTDSEIIGVVGGSQELNTFEKLRMSGSLALASVIKELEPSLFDLENLSED